MSEATGLHGLKAAARDGVLRDVAVTADMRQAVLRKSESRDQMAARQEDPPGGRRRTRFAVRPWQMTATAATLTLLLLSQWHWQPPTASQPQVLQLAAGRESPALQASPTAPAQGAPAGPDGVIKRKLADRDVTTPKAEGPTAAPLSADGPPALTTTSFSASGADRSGSGVTTHILADQSGVGISTAPAGAGELKKLALAAVQPGVKMVYNANLELVVKDARAAMSQVRELAAQSGGYVSDANLARSIATQVDDGQWNGRAVLRIPVAAYGGAREQLKTYGRVLSEREWTQDVTDQYQDLSARIHTLRQHEERLLELVARADKFDDWLKLSGALNDTRAAIEKAEGQQKLLDNQVQYATLNVSLLQYPPSTPAPVSGTGFWGRAGATFSASWHALGERVQVLLFWLIYAVPYLAIAAAVAGGVTAVWLRRRRHIA